MSNIHPHFAQPWQHIAAFKEQLEALILPLLPEPELVGPIPGEQYYRWVPKENVIATWWESWYADLYNLLTYKKGDRIYFQSEWYEDENGYVCWLNPVDIPAHRAGLIPWNPAETMPPEAALYWFKITDLNVIQIKDLEQDDAVMCGCSGLLANGATSDLASLIELEGKWNKAYPEYQWNGDRWVILLTIKQEK
ncbi:MAG: hypothetical protein ACRC62_13740 [Microcoleus sp.]